MTEPITLESEITEPEGYLQPRGYRITYQCPKCEHIYARTFKAPPKKDPPCPNRECVAIQRTAQLQRQVENLTRMLEEQRAPATIGENVKVRAIDATAEIVMQDNNLTDISDNMRQGDIAAPKLAPKMQQAADGFFGGPKTVIGQSQQKTLAQKRAEALGRRAINGAFRGTAVAPNLVLPKQKPNFTTVNNPGYGGPRR